MGRARSVSYDLAVSYISLLTSESSNVKSDAVESLHLVMAAHEKIDDICTNFQNALVYLQRVTEQVSLPSDLVEVFLTYENSSA